MKSNDAKASVSEEPDPEDILRAIVTLNQLFSRDPRRRIEHLLQRVKALREPIASAYATLLASANTERLAALDKRVQGELRRLDEPNLPGRPAYVPERQRVRRLLIDALSLSIQARTATATVTMQSLQKAALIKDSLAIPLVEMWASRMPGDARTVTFDALLSLIGLVPGIGTLANLVAAGRMADELFDEPEDLREAVSRLNLLLAAEFAVRMAETGMLDDSRRAAKEWATVRDEAQSAIDDVCATIEHILEQAERVS